jgi:hypothetical protein
MTMLKRQREAKKADKAAEKRAKRLGIPRPAASEPKPTIDIGALTGTRKAPDESEPT